MSQCNVIAAPVPASSTLLLLLTWFSKLVSLGFLGARRLYMLQGAVAYERYGVPSRVPHGSPHRSSLALGSPPKLT
jgi:hypothetical protein